MVSDPAQALRDKIEQAYPRAALELIAKSLVTDALSVEEAVALTTPAMLNSLVFSTTLSHSHAANRLLLQHDECLPGAVYGRVAKSAREAADYMVTGQPYILMVDNLTRDQFSLLDEAVGLITRQGGSSSLGSLAALHKGKPAMLGVGAELLLESGQLVTLDGSNGLLFKGHIDLQNAQPDHPALETVLEAADAVQASHGRKLDILASVDTIEEAVQARKWGAKGIGALRVERMLFKSDLMPMLQSLVISASAEQRKEILDQIYPSVKDEIKQFLRIMEGYPVRVRLLDTPLQNLLPKDSDDLQYLASLQNIPLEEARTRVNRLREENPYLGLHGTRLSLLYPELYEMQIRAILEAGAELRDEGIDAQPGVMGPFIADPHEVLALKNLVTKTAQEIEQRTKLPVEYTFGVAIELPSACVMASKIAELCDFGHIGGNDLAKTTIGATREAIGTITKAYHEQDIPFQDPYAIVHPSVSALIAVANELGKKGNPQFHLSLGGTLSGDPAAIRIAHAIGLDSITTSPIRIPIARLGAAQAAMEQDQRMDLSAQYAPDAALRLHSAVANDAVNQEPPPLHQRG